MGIMGVVVDLNGHRLTVQRVANILRTERPEVEVRERYTRFAAKRTFYMTLPGDAFPALVTIDKPDYADRGGLGAKKVRKRRQ